MISCKSSNEKSIQLLDKYDFNTGKYKLYGIICEAKPTNFSNKVESFVVEDTITLNKIKHDWQICYTDKRMPCGITYMMVLMKDDSCVYNFGINLECDYLICNLGWFEFPEKLMNKYENLVKRIPNEVAFALHDTLIKKHTFDEKKIKK